MSEKKITKEELMAGSDSLRDLSTRLNSLPLHDRTKLFLSLRSLSVEGHVYHKQWAELVPSAALLENAVEIIKRYEANGLQLDGYGCWLLERIVVRANTSLDLSPKYSEETVLELILRILLEHRTHATFIEIIWHEVRKKSSSFAILCTILIRIVDELPHPIPSDNFVAFFIFMTNYLRNDWNFELAHLGLHTLSVLAPLADVSKFLVNYFFDNILILCERFFLESKGTTYNPSFLTLNSILPPPLSTLFSFLKEISPLHPVAIPSILSHGFIQIGLDLIVAPFKANSTIYLDRPTPDVLATIFQFLSAVSCSVDAMTSILKSISPSLIVTILNYFWFENNHEISVRKSLGSEVEAFELNVRPDISYLFPFVQFVSGTFGNSFFEIDDSENLSLFVERFLEYSIETLKLHSLIKGDQENSSRSIRTIMSCVRIFGHGRLFDSLMGQRLDNLRSQLFDVVMFYLPFNHSPSELTLLNSLALDVCVLLHGWVDPFWKTIKISVQNDITDLLGSINNAFEVERTRSRTCISSVLLNSDTQFVSVSDQVSSPITQTILETEKKYPLISLMSKEPSELLDDFLAEWETNSNEEVSQKIITLLGITRTPTFHNDILSGTFRSDPSQFLHLAEVIVELLTDERHEVNEFPGVQEKCLQLLTDISLSHPQTLSVSVNVTDLVFEILSSVHILSQPFLVDTCISYLSAVCSVPECGKIIIMQVAKFDHIIRRKGSLSLLVTVLVLYRKMSQLFTKFSTDDEKIFMRWIALCIQSRFESFKSFACEYISFLAKNNRQLVFRGFSRVEIEDPIVRQLFRSSNLASILVYMKTLSDLVLNYNESPQWYPDDWILGWSANRKGNRNLISSQTLTDYLQIISRWKCPENLLLLGYTLLVLTSIVEIHIRSGNEEYGLKFFSMYMPELSYLISHITSQHRYVSSFDMHYLPGGQSLSDEAIYASDEFNPSETTSGRSQSSIYYPLLDAPLLPLNPSSEFLSRCAIQTIYTLIIFDQSHDTLFLFYQYELLFQQTPLCEVVVYLMLQFPHNIFIQSKGLLILQKLLENRISIVMMSACFQKLLCQIMETLGDDGSIHSSFCRILLILANYSVENMNSIIESPILKWLSVVLKNMSPENAPLACQVLSILAINELYCNKLCSVGVCQLIIKLLEKHPSVLRVQIEGVKTLSLLGQKSLKCLKQIRNVQGEKSIQKSRQFLKEVLSSCDEGIDQLEHSVYCRDDVNEVLSLSNPKKFIAACIIS